MKENHSWKKTFDGIRPLMEDNFSWKTIFNGIQLQITSRQKKNLEIYLGQTTTIRCCYCCCRPYYQLNLTSTQSLSFTPFCLPPSLSARSSQAVLLPNLVDLKLPLLSWVGANHQLVQTKDQPTGTEIGIRNFINLFFFNQVDKINQIERRINLIQLNIFL